MRRVLVSLTLLAMIGTLAGACSKSSNSSSGANAAPPTSATDTSGGGSGSYGRYGGSPSSTAAGGGGGGGGNAVAIAGFAFSPAQLTVKAGTKVTWTNNDGVTHTVTADNGAFDAGGVNATKTFAFTFSTPGTFAYHCKIHSSMHGTVTVT